MKAHLCLGYLPLDDASRAHTTRLLQGATVASWQTVVTKALAALLLVARKKVQFFTASIGPKAVCGRIGIFTWVTSLLNQPEAVELGWGVVKNWVRQEGAFGRHGKHEMTVGPLIQRSLSRTRNSNSRCHVGTVFQQY